MTSLMKQTFGFLLICISPVCISQQGPLTDVFAGTALEVPDSGRFSFTQNFTPTRSFFSVLDFYREELVWNAEMTFEGIDRNQSYSIRLGKGGQIYSLAGEFGESVPPQHDNSLTNGVHHSPWVDEVWQMVAVDTRLNDRTNSNKYFIHQAGVYVRNPDQTEPFYSPLVASFYDPDERSYSMVNWGQQAHTDDNADVLFGAQIMYYTKYRNIGEGVIQVDNMMYNFGPDAMRHLNVPWGGVRNSTLGNYFVSNNSGGFDASPGQWGNTTRIAVENTAGWAAFSSAENGDGPSLGHVFTNDETLSQGTINWGRVGGVANPRDYFVYAHIKRPDTELTFGQALQFRHFFVLGASIEAVQSKIQQYALTSRVFDSARLPAKNNIPDLSYAISKSGTALQASFTNAANANYSFKARPYANSYPLFLISGADGSSKITTDLYTYSRTPYDGAASNWELLGYVDDKTDIDINNTTVAVSTGPSNDNNLASTGVASQSSVNHSGAALRAIDGNIDGRYSAASVTHTQNELNPWWQVVLGGNASIGEIVVFDRTDACCTSRLAKFTVSVVNSAGATTFSQTIDSTPDPSVSIDAGGAVGSVVKVQINGEGTLSLAEVQVFEN